MEKIKCPVCGSEEWFSYERFDDTSNARDKIYWRECGVCKNIFDEQVILRWKKDYLGRLELVYEKSID